MISKTIYFLIYNDFKILQNTNFIESTNLIIDIISKLPKTYKYPILGYLFSIYIISLIIKFKYLNNLNDKQSESLFYILKKYYPGFSSFSKFYKTFFLLNWS